MLRKIPFTRNCHSCIKPIFPGAVFQKELLTIILLCRVLMQPQKLKQKHFLFWRKSKISETGFDREK